MTPRQLEKLLGGYATDTLTGEERRALFAAALEDQALFDALAREQALRDLLAEPGARARLLAVLDEPRPSLAARLATWLRRPRVIALSATAAAALIAVAVFVPRKSAPAPEHPVMMAELKQPEPPPAVVDLPTRDQPERKKAAPRAFAPPQGGVVGGIVGRAPSSPALPPPPTAEAAQDLALPAGRTFSRPDRVIGVIGGVPSAAAPPPPAPEERFEAASAQPARMSLRQVESQATVAAPPPALRYITEGPLHTGTPTRLEFESVESGWLYVFTAEPEGWRLAASGKIGPGQPASVSLRFDEPGRKELLAVVSRTEQTALREGEIAIPPAAAASRRIALDVTRP